MKPTDFPGLRTWLRFEDGKLVVSGAGLRSLPGHTPTIVRLK